MHDDAGIIVLRERGLFCTEHRTEKEHKAAHRTTRGSQMFLPQAAGTFMAEDGNVDDESLRRETGSKCPNFNVEDPTRRIWIFTTAR